MQENQLDILLQKAEELKARIDKHRPIRSQMLNEIKEYFRIGFTYTTNALEGNTLSESETKVIIEDGITVGGKSIREHQEATGHSNAYSFMYSLIKNQKISEKDIKELHRIFFKEINPDQAGSYRDKKVFISGSKYLLPPPGKVTELMSELPSELTKIKTADHPIIAAAKAHIQFVFIHPFVDGNGRVARLLMNLILTQLGYCICIIPPVSRLEYIEALEEAHTDPRRFYIHIAEMVLNTQKDYLRYLES